MLTARETLEYLLKNKKSLIRLGDGETAIYTGSDIYFQKYDSKLANILKIILKEYKHNEVKYLLAFPNSYLSKSVRELKYLNKLSIWNNARYVFYKYFNKNKIYGEAMVFFWDTPLKNDEISLLWRDCRNIILIHSNKNYFDDFKTKFHDKHLFFIQIPKKDAFSVFNKLITKIIEMNKSSNFIDDTKILVSAGPTAKAIIYKLSNMGFICYDMGHYFDYKFYNKLRAKKGLLTQ